MFAHSHSHLKVDGPLLELGPLDQELFPFLKQGHFSFELSDFGGEAHAGISVPSGNWRINRSAGMGRTLSTCLKKKGTPAPAH